MKNVFLFLFTFSFFIAKAQFNYSTEQIIADATTTGYRLPNICNNANGDIFGIASKQVSASPPITTNFYFFKKNVASSGFTTPTLIPTLPADSYSKNNIFAFGNTIYVAVTLSNGDIKIVKSYDAGVTWTSPIVAFSPALYGITNMHENLEIAVSDSDSSFVYLQVMAIYPVSQYKYIIVRSTDGGSTWSAPIQTPDATAPNANIVCDCCPASLLANGSNVYSMYRINRSNVRDNWLAISTDYGATFPTHILVDSTNWNISFCPVERPAMLHNKSTNELYSVHRNGTTDKRIWISKTNLNTNMLEESHEILPLPIGTNDYSVFMAGSTDTIGFTFYRNDGSSTVTMFGLSVNGTSGYFRTDTLFTPSLPSRTTYVNGTFYFIYGDFSTNTLKFKTFTVPNYTGIQANETLWGSAFYSNDLHSIVINNFSFNSNTHLSIFDITGKKVMDKVLYENGSIDISSLNKGAYIFSIYDDKNRITKKIIVE